MNPVHYSSKSNEWETPQSLYDELNREFGFTLDPCATHENQKCEKYYTIEDDGLSKSWEGETVFMNPPYGREIGAWVKKAYDETRVPNTTVVCLLPARTDTRWFHDYCQKGEVRFLKGRLKFVNRALPSWNSTGDFKLSPAPFPSMIVVLHQI